MVSRCGAESRSERHHHTANDRREDRQGLHHRETRQRHAVHARPHRGDALRAGERHFCRAGRLFALRRGRWSSRAAAESLRGWPRNRRRVSLHPGSPLREGVPRQYAHASRPALKSMGGARHGTSGARSSSGATRSRDCRRASERSAFRRSNSWNWI